MSILMLATAVLYGSAGCAGKQGLSLEPLGQSDLDPFLDSGRDSRVYGIDAIREQAGARFETANRVHAHRWAKMKMASAGGQGIPWLKARGAGGDAVYLLVDASARNNWLLLSWVEAMDYRVFKPSLGEYPDHVALEIPGYAGVANKIVLEDLHIESPVFFVPPARGGLGALARTESVSGMPPREAKARLALGQRTQGVLGAAALRSFSYVHFDFAGRTVVFSTDGRYRPASAENVLAALPLQDWRGRPAVEVHIEGHPVQAVLDTAGGFALSLPGRAPTTPVAVRAGPHEMGLCPVVAHADLGLPEDYPARIGLDMLRRYAVTVDYKQARVWLEQPNPQQDSGPAAPQPQDSAPPVRYRGVTP